MPPVNEAEHVSGLSVKAQAAVEHYLLYGEKAQAYRHGFGRGKSKDKVFENNVHRFFSRAKVMAEIQRRQKANSERTNLTVDCIIEELDKIARPAVPESVETADRIKALTLIGKHIGMWEKKKQGALIEAPLFNIIMPVG